MIDSATGMKPGERYAVESLERAHQFQGFFLDGKYYLEPELLTAVGWLEGQQFLYDALDPAGNPVFPDGVAGVIEDLVLQMADGTTLPLTKIHVTVATDEPQTSDEKAAFEPSPQLNGGGRWHAAEPGHRVLMLSAVALVGGCIGAILGARLR